MLGMWEFGMDGGRFDVTEFKNRQFSLPALDDDCVQPESLLSRTALQINATTKCISAAHTILESFSTIPIEKLSKAPNITFVRALYALVALMRVDYAVGTDPDMEELLESQSLKVEHFLKIVIQRITDSIGAHTCRIPSHWKFVVKEKLKTWWDEYQEWRKRGPKSKRQKTSKGDESESTTRNHTPTFATPKVPERSSTYPSLSNTEQRPSQLPNYSMSTPYSTWNTSHLPLDTTTSTQAIGDRAAFTSDIGDFSSVFQNGDLYLWDGMNIDSFGGWAPQGGVYMGYGPMHGQGL